MRSKVCQCFGPDRADPSRSSSPIAAPRAEQLTREYVTAFFDRQLRGCAEPLLDGPSSDNPEVLFQQPQP